MKNQSGFFVCVARCEFTLQIWYRVNQPFFITSDINRTIRRCLFIVQTSDRDYVIFCPILLIILQFFTEYNLKRQIALIQ